MSANRYSQLLCLCIAAGWQCDVQAAGPAGVKLDGSIGAPAQILGGPTYHITQNLGQLAGANLFFSFQYFNVATGETALFSTTSAGIRDVVSRVTGGYASTIDGTLRLQAAAGAPNFFFINPSGVTLTSNASVDVPAAFYVSTAGYLRFPDGNFYVDPSKVSTLSSAPPEAFGFLGKTRAAVDVQGASLASGGSAPLGMVAGDITIDGAGNLSGIESTGGEVRLIATGAQAGEVPLSGRFSATDGSVTLENGGGINAPGSATVRAGAVYVSAGALTVDGGASGQAGILSSADAAGAGPILLDVAGAVRVNNGAEILSYTTGAGAAADVTLNAGSLTLDGGPQGQLTGLYSDALQGSSGDTGKLTVTTSGATNLTNGGSMTTFTIGTGNGSGVALRAGSLNIIGGVAGFTPEISTSTFLDGGVAGNIDVQVAGAAVISNGGQVLSATNSAHNAGDVNFQAAALNINGDTAIGYTGIASNTFGTPAASAGHVTVTVDSLTMEGSTAAGRTTISSDSGSLFFARGGTAGTVAVDVAGAATLSRGAYISSDTYTTGRGGDVTLTTGSLSIDNAESAHATGISSSADQNSSGAAGDVTVQSAGGIRVVDGGLIRSDTYGTGNAGKVSVDAASLDVDGSGTFLDTGISSSVAAGAQGNAGQVSITAAGAVTLSGGGGIVSVTNGHGNAGTVRVSAGSLALDSTHSPKLSLLSSSADVGSTGNAGAVVVQTPGALTLKNGSRIVTDTFGPGEAGNVSVDAGSLTMFGADSGVVSQISSTTEPGATGHAGTILVDTAGAVSIGGGAQVLSSTFGAGNAGDVNVRAQTLTVDGTGAVNVDSLVSSSGGKGSTGAGGQVVVTTSGATTLLNGGQILSAAFGAGNAGGVTVNAGSINIEGTNSVYASEISSAAEAGSSGNAGQVHVAALGPLTLFDGGLILSDTHASGNAGDVTVEAGSLAVAGSSTVIGNNQSPTPQYSGISSAAEFDSTGNAGIVSVAVAGAAALYDGGEILSDTRGPGNAGDVTLTAASLLIRESQPDSFAGISSSAYVGSSGHAGNVDVTTSGLTSIEDGGQLLSATFSSGNAGSVSLKAGSLAMDGSGGSTNATGIISGAHAGSSGIAGTVTVDVGAAATLSNGAQISSSAQANSSGQAGTVILSAGSLVLNSASQVSIEDDATVANPAAIAPTHISVQARDIRMMNDAQITAASNGNVAASSIEIDFVHSLSLDPSRILTTSKQGNGGAITIVGSGVLWLNQSSITTSVLGSTNGNGGNIGISTPFIVLDSGAIQANTHAPNASGGDVTIHALALIPSFSSYILGGSAQLFDPLTAGLNIVQAAAPQGVSGTLNVTVPTLDLGSSLAGLTGHPAGPGALARSPCSYRQGSSFSLGGRGGLPPSARSPLWVDAEGADTAAARDQTSSHDSALSALFACR